MDIARVKYRLNHAVRLVCGRYDLDAEYILTGCILRKREADFYYQAELLDPNKNSLVIADLDNVVEV